MDNSEENQLARLEFFLNTISGVIEALERHERCDRHHIQAGLSHLNMAADKLATAIWYTKKELGGTHVI